MRYIMYLLDIYVYLLISPYRVSDSNPVGGGAFIIARRGTVYVTPGPCARSTHSGRSVSSQPASACQRLLAL